LNTLAYCRLNDLKSISEVINHCEKSIRRKGCHVCPFLNRGYSEFKGMSSLLLCIADVNDARRCELESFTCQQDNSQASCPDLLFAKPLRSRINGCCIIELKLDVKTTDRLELRRHLEEVERKRDCANKLTNNYCCSRSQSIVVFENKKVAKRIKDSEELRSLIDEWKITITASETLDACFGKPNISR